MLLLLISLAIALAEPNASSEAAASATVAPTGEATAAAVERADTTGDEATSSVEALQVERPLPMPTLIDIPPLLGMPVPAAPRALPNPRAWMGDHTCVGPTPVRSGGWNCAGQTVAH